MKDCPNCGRTNFTGLHNKVPIRVIIFPQTRDCTECGKELTESGWFESGEY